MEKEITEYDNLYEKVPHGNIEFPYEIHITESGNGFALYPHLHKEFELLVMEQGNGIIVIDNQEYILEEGDSCFINSREIHYGKRYTDDNIRFYAIVFSDKLFGEPYRDGLYDRFIGPVINNKRIFPSYITNHQPWMREIHRIESELHCIEEHNSWENELLIRGKLYELWSILTQNSSLLEESRNDPKLIHIKKIIKYVDDNYSSKITVSQLAEQCLMSEGHFTRVFSKVMERSPYQYVVDVRISKSCELLRNSNKNIGEIGLECGFGDYSYYTKMFKLGMGCTPSEYRVK